MAITGPQARAARALIEWPRDHVARLSETSVETLQAFETNRVDPGEEAKERIRAALEDGGALFIDEDERGLGVRLKFSKKEAKAITRMEGEGGPVGDDDI